MKQEDPGTIASKGTELALTSRACALLALFSALTLSFAWNVNAQAIGGAQRSGPDSKLVLSNSILNFHALSEESGNAHASETKSLTIKDGGSLALSVTVNPSVGSQFFRIIAGQGTTLIQPHGESTVTVEFAPLNKGSFSGGIAISSDATVGKRSAKVMLTGSARTKKAPTPTPTARSTAAETTDVLTYHNDNARTAQNLTEQTLTPASVKTSFGLLFQDSVDGKVDGQPLIKTQVNIPSQGTHNVLYVVTENDSVYAFDADNAVAPLWQVSVLGSGEIPSDDRGCSQVTPQIGITSTPVIDPSSGPNGTIYLVAMSKTSGVYFQRIHALDITTGAEEFGGPVTVAATFPPGPAFSPMQYKERAALLLLNHQLFTAWASHCDIGQYNGWIIAYNENTLAQTSAIDVTVNGDQGAIWQSGGGLAADSLGNIYLLDGNGTFDATLNANGFPNKSDFGNGFLKLSTSSGLQVADFFEPFNTVSESDADTDLGSGGAMVLPDMTDSTNTVRHLAVGAGKDGNIYLLDRDNMGKWNSETKDNSNAYQVITGALGNEFAVPAYFNGTVYYGGVGEHLQAFSFTQARLTAMPTSASSKSYGYPGTSPSISAYGNSNAIVWAIENGSSGGVLHAYDASNLANELYNSGPNSFADNKFVTPTIANGKVYVGTPNSVAVFGLKQRIGVSAENRRCVLRWRCYCWSAL